MARYPRITQKIFGSTSGFQQMGQIGSLNNGTPTYTTNLTTIQALGNYLVGLYSVSIGANSIAMQDLNGLFFLITSQIAYLLQVGLPEWDAATTYFIGDTASDGLGNTYVSLTDNNLNNALSNLTNWSRKSSIPLGSVLATFPNLSGAYTTTATTVADANGWVLCGGQTISDASSPMNGVVIPNINNTNFLRGSTTAGGTGGSATLVHTHTFAHVHQWGYHTAATSSAGQGLYTPVSPATFIGNASFTTTSATEVDIYQTITFASGGSSAQFNLPFNAAQQMYTAGAVDGSGNLNPVSSGPSASAIIPPFISAVYIMRIK
jgi:hypothetical protein